ncbi:hypothetical protein EG346_04260 [Chryseobacterium carnipullorum]|uniref:Uncharacterized protein n=1 Tax=Chryseobacterium carnipullorum TaxID=1124835 RepID=A0A376EIV6_CHRCU|nr:hypothetical protein [Chryseobacterium carnipullorum]AZA47443.1 hypothetical protein EG346_04260 [Chryseobacterium carnipullorum]AZA66781.1 hypothetical protein EG345_20380 [Chryseobacterium carnipullorum]STD09988.1 Uncharacterised protein [Chryseobacterium carnipullorum]
MIKIILIILFSFFCLSCNKKEKEGVEIYMEKKQQLNSHCLLVKIIIKNNDKKNYLIPIGPNFYLDNDKKMLQSIPSQIITSDFITFDDRKDFMLQEFTEKNLYKGFSHEAFKMAILKNYEEYANSLFFIPKNSKRELFLAFNDYMYHNNTHNRNKIFSDKFTKIRVNNYAKEDVKNIESLIKHNKLNYIMYRKNIYLNDSLYINK